MERGNAEVVGQALEVLADEAFPRHLFAELVKQFIAFDVPVVSSSIATAITEHRITSYNVCYTKLLRIGFASTRASWAPAARHTRRGGRSDSVEGLPHAAVPTLRPRGAGARGVPRVGEFV